MYEVGFPILYVLFVWWFSTGAILLLVGMPTRSYPWSLAAATGVGVAAMIGIWASADLPTVAGAFCAFTCALLVWGWHETAFLLGYVTGSRRRPLPAGVTGRDRFRLASQTVMHHELAILATVVAIAVLTWGQPNQVALWAFTVLWLMRLSAKLNIFLGVGKLAEEFLPAHLAYLKSYFRRARGNALLPVSIILPTGIVWLMGRAALAPDATAFDTAGLILAASLLALAVIEHLFFILPVPDTALWRWAVREPGSHAAAGAGTLPQPPVARRLPLDGPARRRSLARRVVPSDGVSGDAGRGLGLRT